MRFAELKIGQMKNELSKLNLPTTGIKTELQKRLIEEFRSHDIAIGI